MKKSASLLFVARSVKYRSSNDERAFFEWLARIDGFESVKGVGNELHIQMNRDLGEHGLRDVIALFFRYNIDLTQIPKVIPPPQQPWLLKEGMYWFSAMFPKGAEVSDVRPRPSPAPRRRPPR